MDPTPTVSHGRILRVIYFYAGIERKSDFRSCLKQFCASSAVELDFREFDMAGSPQLNVLDDAAWQTCLSMIRDFQPHVTLAIPPSNTYSRARHSSKRHFGPPPIRDFQFRHGYPWLSARHKRQADEGNCFVNRTWDLFELAVQTNSFFLGEHPEDLGVTSQGRPASIWQDERFQNLLTMAGVSTFAVFQCAFGTDTAKPTRFVTNLAFAADDNIFFGLPRFDSRGMYLGPLPPHCLHGGHSFHLIASDMNGSFNTALAATLPPALCTFLVSGIFSSVFPPSAAWGLDSSGGSSSVAKRKGAPSQDLDDEMSGQFEQAAPSTGFEPDLHFSALHSGCVGPPMKFYFAGKSKDFVDGFGKCSPGRWLPSARDCFMDQEANNWAVALRKLLDEFCIGQLPDMAKKTFMLSTGKLQGSPFSSQALMSLRSKWAALLPNPTLALVVPPYQPFFLHGLSQTLRILQDPDWAILDNEPDGNFAEGVAVGHLSPLARVPQVFGPPCKAASYDETKLNLDMENYKSGPEVEAILQEQFELEEREGRMFCLSEAEARARFPGNSLRIAAQGVIDKHGGGHRIIHDATHGVRVNNEIVNHNRLENPGPGEFSHIMVSSVEAQERVMFGVTGDIAKAHRRFVHKPSEWGVLACKTNSQSRTVWFNRTGTFGVASASFWWARLAALIGRLVFRISARDWFFMTLYVDDLQIAAGGEHRWLTIWRILSCLEMVGVPFAYHKFAGGFTLDYVGFWIDYGRFSLGISEKRVRWILESIDSIKKAAWLVDVRRFHELHGRLGFMSQVLPWMRPFLAPGYSWLSAVRKGGVLQMPKVLQKSCEFMHRKLSLGCRATPCDRTELDFGEIFRTDAKCTDDKVVVGGWRMLRGQPTTECPWFSLELDQHQVPWLFKPGQGSAWASTAAELLAALIALMIFDLGVGDNVSAKHNVVLHAGVDNKATDALVRRGLSTKAPVMFVLMEYLHQADCRGLRCQLDWRPREQNQLADDLTNSLFDAFKYEFRIPVSWSDLKFDMLDEFAQLWHEDPGSKAVPTFQSSATGQFQKSSWS